MTRCLFTLLVLSAPFTIAQEPDAALVARALDGGAVQIRAYWALAVGLIGGLDIAGAVDTQSADAESNKRIIRQHIETMNRGEWRQAAEYFADDVRHHLGNWQGGQQRTVQGKKVLTDNLEDIFRTFPDWKMDIIEIVAEGESVVVRCRVSGTHKGVATLRVNGGLLVGVQPTGKRFEIQHIHWYRVRNGKITDHFTNRDDLGMTQQLGLLAPAR